MSKRKIRMKEREWEYKAPQVYKSEVFTSVAANVVTYTAYRDSCTLSFYIDRVIPEVEENSGAFIAKGIERELILEVHLPISQALIMAKGLLQQYEEMTKDPKISHVFGPALVEIKKSRPEKSKLRAHKKPLRS